MINRDPYERLLAILRTDQKKLKYMLLRQDARKRNRKTLLAMCLAAAVAALAAGTGNKIFVLLMLPVAALLIGTWYKYWKRRGRPVAELLRIYMQKQPPERRQLPIAQVIDELLGGGSEQQHMIARHRLSKAFGTVAAALIAAVCVTGAVTQLKPEWFDGSHTPHIAYTVSPTATPIPAYVEENGGVTLYNYRGEAVDGVLEIPAEVDGLPVLAIGKLAFAQRNDLVTVVVPEGVTRIDSGAFRNCESLQQIVLPQSLTELGAETFKLCMSLKSITIPENVKELRAETFAFCSALKQVDLPEGLGKISANAFDNCYTLETVVLPQSLHSVSAYAFRNCSRLKSIVLPDSVNTIGAYAFSGCTALESVTMPAVMLNGKISERTFEDCARLTAIRIPDGVYKISERAFYGCDALAEVQFPSTLREIGSSAFRSCRALKQVTLPSLCTVDERAFKDSPTTITRK